MKRTFGAPVPYDAASYIEELEAEVDRLTVRVKGFPFLPYVEGQNAERARALPVIEAARAAEPYLFNTPLEGALDRWDALRAALAEYDR